MLSSPPWSSWPLHVKFFHLDAVQEWSTATASIPDSLLPPGLTVSVELEGVDGKSTRPILNSSKSKSAKETRDTPIDVKDSECLAISSYQRYSCYFPAVFTSAHLAKHEQLLAANGGTHECTVCSETIDLSVKVFVFPFLIWLVSQECITPWHWCPGSSHCCSMSPPWLFKCITSTLSFICVSFFI